MEKENGESSVTDAIGGNGNSTKGDTSLLDAASLFGAYWGRDTSSQATAASLLGGGAGFPGAGGSAMSGFGLLGSGGGAAGPTSGRYPPNSTLSVAASQAASLGLHPAASAAWWSMASQLAAQDYLARLQASGLAAFPPDPYAAALGALGSSSSNARNSSSRSPRAPRTPSHRSHNKDKNSVNNNSSSQSQSNSQNNLRSSYGLPKTSSPSLSNAQNMSMTSSLSALGLNSLAGSHSKATTHSTSSITSSSNKHSTNFSGKSSSSAAAKASALSGAYLAQGVGGGTGSSKSSGSSLKDKELALLRGDLIMAQAAMAQNAYQAAVAAAASSHKGGKNSLFNNPFALGSLSNNSSSDKDRHSNLDSIANLPHTILSAALEGSDNASILGGVRLPPDTEIIKYTSSIVGPKIPGTTNRGRKKTISLDPPHVSVLPALSSTGLLVERGGPAKRPKLETDYGSLPMAHQNSSTPTSGANSSNNDRVEVIKLPSGSNSQNSPFNSSSYTGVSKELLQSIANQSGLSLAVLEKQFAEQFGSTSSSYQTSPFGSSNISSTNQDIGLNLSSKPSSSPQHPTDLSQREASPASTINDEDAPLNLSLKSSTNQSENDWKSSNNSLNRTQDESVNSLNSLSNITAKLGARTAPPPPDRVSRRKPGAKPRRVIQDTVIQSSVSPQRNTSPSLQQRDKDNTGFSHLVGTPLASESPGPKSSGSEDNDVGPWHSNKEGRPRNLGRGVSKPKKNTVASLLAQSRALGIRPALAHQYLQEAADLLNPELQEKLKAAMNDPSSLIEMSESESEGPWESCPSDTEGSDAFGSRSRPYSDHTHLRIPLTLGWKRETLIKGLSRSGGIKGDVVYYPPEPHTTLKIKSIQELTSYLEKNPCPPLTKDNFSFSSRPLVGSFLQISPTFGLPGTETEVLKMSETEVAKRLDEAKRAIGSLAGSTLAVEQRIELARQQQAAREARKDAVKGREQARLAREQERSEKAEQAKRDREARSQQIMEDWDWLPSISESEYKIEFLHKNSKEKQNLKSKWDPVSSTHDLPKMWPLNISITAVPALNSSQNDLSSYNYDEYNALDKIVNFTKNATLKFSSSKLITTEKKSKPVVGKDTTNPMIKTNTVSVIKSSKEEIKKIKESNLLSKILNSYSRINEFMNHDCSWTNFKPLKLTHNKSHKEFLNDLESLETSYLKAKENYLFHNFILIPNPSLQAPIISSYIKEQKKVECIDIANENKEKIQNCYSKIHSLVSPTIDNMDISLFGQQSFNLSLKPSIKDQGASLARRKRQEELEKQRHEDQTRKQQERELKRQQALMLKEQMYIVEMSKQREMMFTAELERERRRQHMALIKQLDCRRRFEEREKRKHQVLLDKLLLKEKRLEERKKEIELLTELRKPQEDTTLSDQKQLPLYNRIPGLKLSAQAMADILMVFEFLHNFGQTLGFDMDTLPSLNTLQMALLPDYCVDAEEELISVMTHLLACAIEDPGIPHPGRHTTILGQTLRTNEITPANISELLRIYLYAHATGEVKALTGINPERDREKRIADHHQNDSDALQQSCHGRNLQYYRHLHSRPAWKLAEKLRIHPYASLDPTTKANILARLCDNLLQSKPILRQIDASLENLNHLRKERYLMDTKLRKLKVMHSRKVRMENAEKQQALALERMQKMVEENETAQNALKEKSIDKENDITNIEACEHKNDVFYSELNDNFSKKNTEESMIENTEIEDNIEKQTETMHTIDSPQHDLVNSINNSILIAAPAPYMKDQEKEGIMEIAKANGTASIVSKDVHITDKDSVIGDSELILSDVESEGTQPEEDEDKNLPAEELSKKLERLIKQSDVQLQNLISGSHALRATCFGQDRFWRRYWSLSKCGGIYIESMESAQPEIMDYHERMELSAKRREEEEANSKLQNRKRNKRGSKSEKNKNSDGTDESDGSKIDDQLSDLELQNIKSELNLSDHTRIIKYESNVQMGDGKVEGSPIKMEEKFIQQQKVTEDCSLDIEDSIPTAFLVQKPQVGKNVFISTNSHLETEIKNENPMQVKVEDIKPDISSSVESENKENIEVDVSESIKIKKEESSLMNNLEELKKIAESVIQPWETKENDTKITEDFPKDKKIDEKDEAEDPEKADILLITKMSEGKWFSILRREMPVLISDNPHINEDDNSPEKESCLQKPLDIANANNYKGTFVNLAFCDNSSTCSEILLTQGNRWEVINNLNLLSNPNTLFSNLNGIHNMQPINTTFYHADSSLTMSGLDQEMLDSNITDKPNSVEIDSNELLENCNKEESSVDITYKDNTNETLDENDCTKTEHIKMKLLSNNLNCVNNIINFNQGFIPNFSNVNLPALTAYVSCDSPAPLQMTPEETEQLEYCKINGLPKKLEGNFVIKDMRHGWWRINDVDQLQETLEKLHPRGVRERELHNSFLLSLQQTSGKLHIEKGDIAATELSISHLDRVIAQNGGFPLPDNPDIISVKTCRRIEMSLLEQVEALEDRVAAASMQVKGWKPGMRADDTNIELDEEEDAIELARERLLSLEAAIERRYLRPPLGAGSLPAPAPSSMNTSNSSPIASNETTAGTDTPVGSRPSSPTHNHTDNANDTKAVGIPRGLATWREAAARCQTTSQLAMVLHALESAIAWDKSIMKANCQFCQSGDSEDKLLLCDGCDKGYHTYCFKPKMDKIPDGDWYCFECLNKATGDKVCIVCGGRSVMSGGAMVPVAKGRLIPCAICPRAYHQDCHYPPMTKVPRGKWYCVNCISKAPPKKPRNKKSSKNSSNADNQDSTQPPSPAPSQASTATTIDDCPITMSQFCQSSLSSVQSTPEKHFQNNHSQMNTFSTPDNVKSFSAIHNSVANSPVNVMEVTSKGGSRDLTEYLEKEASNKDFIDSDDINMSENTAMEVDNIEHNFTENTLEDFVMDNNQEIDHKSMSSNFEKHVEESSNMDPEISYNSLENDSNSGLNNEEYNSKGNKRYDKDIDVPSSPVRDREAKHSCNKKDRNSIKRLNKELAPCKALLEEMESHDDSWPFLLPVNTKQFPTYKKVIRSPMDLSTIKRKLQDLSYKSKEEFACDVRQIFHNCEVFNEDESPVGQAGHGMRRFFEEKWSTV